MGPFLSAVQNPVITAPCTRGFYAGYLSAVILVRGERGNPICTEDFFSVVEPYWKTRDATKIYMVSDWCIPGKHYHL